MIFQNNQEQRSLPRHIAIILDGNGRWAASHALPRALGHKKGCETLEQTVEDCARLGIEYLTVYGFSTENWKRSEEEVRHLMKLLLNILKADLPIFIENEVRLRVVGSREGLSDQLIKAIDEAEEKTADLKNGELVLCLNYGGHLEIADAVKKIVQSGISTEEITPELIAQNIYAPEVPPCDLIVRTSSEQRLSNFMLWRSAYSELMFIEKNWPDMTVDDVSVILEEYANRNRRFGK